jgi:hypothetical protein
MHEYKTLGVPLPGRGDLTRATEGSTNLINVAKNDLLDGIMLEYFTYYAAITAADNKHFLRIRV